MQTNWAQEGLQITEIMAAPASDTKFPAEYIEIYNNSNRSISLANMNLRVATTNIPLLDYFLAPKQYIVLTAAGSSSVLEPYGTVMGLASWRRLNNSGAAIALIDREGKVTDQVVYSDSWYNDTAKKRGGWSLERINPGLSCNNQLTWAATVATQGGTPGQQNSIRDDNFVPQFRFRLLEVQTNRIRLKLDSPPEALNLQDKNQFVVQPGGIKATHYTRSADTLDIFLTENLSPDLPYELQLTNVDYCARRYDTSIPFIFSSKNSYNDIIVNEVLFNPKDGSADFVEIYNRSVKTINLQYWLLGERAITEQLHLFPPGEYRVLSNSSQAVYQSYPKAVRENFIDMPAFPTYTNTAGTVILRDQAGQTIDSVVYSNTMHQPFLVDVKGISLERQSAAVDGNAAGNLVSASTLAGGATPGYVNSNQAEKKAAKNLLQLQSKTFSPDQDGFEDLLRFTYAFEESNMMLSLTIFDDGGRLVNRLIRNKSVGYAGELSWDGIDQNGQKCSGGIYVYYAEITSSTGHYQTFKGGFALSDARKKY